jgi:hypothetical protein
MHENISYIIGTWDSVSTGRSRQAIEEWYVSSFYLLKVDVGFKIIIESISNLMVILKTTSTLRNKNVVCSVTPRHNQP